MSENNLMNSMTTRRGMRWKMMLVMVSMIVALVAILTVLQVNAQRASLKKSLATHSSFLEEQMHKKADKATNRMAVHIETQILTSPMGVDHPQVKKIKPIILEAVADIDELRYVVLMQGDESIIALGANLDRPLQEHILSGSVSAFAAGQQESMHYDFNIDKHAFMETVIPVLIHDRQWGVLRLGFSLDQLNQTLADSQAYIDGEIRDAVIRATLTSVLFLILGALAVYYFARRWTDPIQKLVHFSHELASGDFSATPHVSTRTKDEIGVLVGSLEEMATSLRQSHEQLEEYSHTLEDKVDERTRELEMARDRAIEADKSKSEFLANMSHEIRTPINAVIGLTHLALDGEKDPQQRDYLTKTMESSEALLSVINDVLDFSKIEANKLDMDCIDFEIEEVMHNLASIGGVRASEKGLDFLIDVPTDMPYLRGDPYRLGQVLLNLVNNAVKFTDSGQIIVAARILEDTADGISLRFTVTDSGIGLSEEEQSRLFQAFTQADASITRFYGGTGLGLAICKQLVELMHGQIGVDSVQGKGSCFHFTACFEHGQQQERETVELPPELEEMRVLIVDDNPTSKIIIARYAESFGFRPEQASTVAEAARLIKAAHKKEPFGLLIVDWTLAEMSGLESLSLIQQASGIQEMPAAFLTANFGLKISEDDLTAAGFSALLQKPLTMASILKTARKVLGMAVDEETDSTVRQSLPVEMVAHLTGARLLLVEDNEINQMVAEGLLVKAGISLAVAHNGQEAVDAVAEDVFDGVLMDMQMPVMDGLEATRIIRQRFDADQLPIIAMTANAMAQDVERCLEAGMNDHVAKPVDPQDLYGKLDKWISSSRITKAGVSETVLLDDSAVPAIAGINVEEGVKRVGGDHGLYRSILDKFISSQSDTIERARTALSEDDHEQARLLFHSLKGVAGNIGAEDLYRQAADLEQMARDGQMIGDDQLSEAEQRLVSVITSVSSVLGETSAAQSTGPDEGVDPLPVIEQMKSMLDEHNGDAVDLLTELSAALQGHAAAGHLNMLKQRLDAYDFETALAELAVIEAELNNNG